MHEILFEQSVLIAALMFKDTNIPISESHPAIGDLYKFQVPTKFVHPGWGTCETLQLCLRVDVEKKQPIWFKMPRHIAEYFLPIRKL